MERSTSVSTVIRGLLYIRHYKQHAYVYSYVWSHIQLLSKTYTISKSTEVFDSLRAESIPYTSSNDMESLTIEAAW